MVVDAFDDQIHYDSGWNRLESVGMQTSTQGASMTFDFVGAFRVSTIHRFKYSSNNLNGMQVTK